MPQSLDTGSSTSSDLISRVQRDEPEAWARLVRLYSPLVYFWCRRQADLSPEDAADVMQSVFLAVARGIGGFVKRDGCGSFRGWLRVTTSNKLRDHLRGNSRRPRAVGGSAADRILREVPARNRPLPDLSEGDARSERAILIDSVLEELRPQFDAKSWQAFWQAELDGRPRREIAEELQMSLSAVNQAIYRIRKRLRQELEDLLE